MDHFYITLQSDSFGYYFPANTIADIRTKHSTQLQLKNDRCEVGLVEISYPKGHKKQILQNILFLIVLIN